MLAHRMRSKQRRTAEQSGQQDTENQRNDDILSRHVASIVHSARTNARINIGRWCCLGKSSCLKNVRQVAQSALSDGWQCSMWLAGWH